MRDLASVQVAGPLAQYANGFRVRLAMMGYAPGSVAVHLRVMAHLSRWLDEHTLDAATLSTAVVEEFLEARRAAGRTDARSTRSLRPLLEYLREDGLVCADPPGLPGDPAEAVLSEFAEYLRRERGLAPATVQRNCELVRPFVAAHLPGGAKNAATLTAAQVSTFILGRAEGVAPATVQRTGTALRALLRFLHVRGLVDASLAGAVPTAANWKLSGLPKYLTSDQIAALVASCDRDTAVGRRDRAILLLLARLGLRAGEVAGLLLEDIDWRLGELTVRGKGGRHDRLPLPEDVGEAVAAYLSVDRPASAAGREVFISARAPHRALTRGAVTQAVARAARRCGLGTVYAHRLRHSAATGMLHGGASLEEIGQVLRHRHVLTTAVYAKVDLEGLRALARPWPGAAA